MYSASELRTAKSATDGDAFPYSTIHTRCQNVEVICDTRIYNEATQCGRRIMPNDVIRHFRGTGGGLVDLTNEARRLFEKGPVVQRGQVVTSRN